VCVAETVGKCVLDIIIMLYMQIVYNLWPGCWWSTPNAPVKSPLFAAKQLNSWLHKHKYTHSKMYIKIWTDIFLFVYMHIYICMLVCLRRLCQVFNADKMLAAKIDTHDNWQQATDRRTVGLDHKFKCPIKVFWILQ